MMQPSMQMAGQPGIPGMPMPGPAGAGDAQQMLASSAPQQAAMPQAQQQQQLQPQMTAGMVRKWLPDKSYGFITPVGGGQDVFVHSSAFGGGSLTEGDQVIFRMTTDERNGKLRAEGVYGPAVRQAQGSLPLGFPGMGVDLLGGGGAMPAATAQGHGRGTKGSGSNLIGQTITGTVREWLDERGYGFITPSNQEGSIFVHNSNIANGTKLQAGMQVTCQVVADQRGSATAAGKPRAENVQPLSTPDPAMMQQQYLLSIMMQQQKMAGGLPGGMPGMGAPFGQQQMMPPGGSAPFMAQQPLQGGWGAPPPPHQLQQQQLAQQQQQPQQQPQQQQQPPQQ
eukprot:TRINITY_DN6287_c3_g1_i3.p1 TRINITY_DN6287_c3_g1~~TRINITY_DN6287_c3_g1_i3.p1  ORF type:complete len:338 (+),score=152.17 TRINITY_DN6287_c3_g1_i3:328-1341(+)